MIGVDRILAADVGGTKTFVGEFTLDDGRVRPVRIEKFLNDGFQGVDAIVTAFLKGGNGSEFRAACFGVACPVEANRCRLTNLPWSIDGVELRSKLKLKRLELINDLVATGFGVGLLSGDDLLTLNKGRAREGNAALIAAGTGLGESIMFHNATTLVPSPSEGGHTDFGPRDLLEIELLGYLMERVEHVSYERILSGTGLVNIFYFLMDRSGRAIGPDLQKRFDAGDSAGVVFEEAVAGNEVAGKALSLFIRIYGAEAGNLALKGMAIGGVYVGGGIAPRIIGEMKKGGFMEAFVDKGRFRDLLSEIPVYVIMNERTALLGAARYASELIS